MSNIADFAYQLNRHLNGDEEDSQALEAAAERLTPAEVGALAPRYREAARAVKWWMVRHPRAA